MKPCEFRAPLPSNARQRAATGVGHQPLGLAVIVARRSILALAGACYLADCLSRPRRPPSLPRQAGAALAWDGALPLLSSRGRPPGCARRWSESRPRLCLGTARPCLSGLKARTNRSRGDALRGRRRARSDRAGQRLDCADRHISSILSLLLQVIFLWFYVAFGIEFTSNGAGFWAAICCPSD